MEAPALGLGEREMESRSTAEETALVETFISVTSATPEEARFFLESHNWLVDSAIHSFYDTSPSSPFDPHPAQPPAGDGDGADGEDDDDEDYVPENDVPPPVAVPVVRSTGSRGEKRPAAKASGARSSIRTLADLNRRSSPGSDSDSDGPQEYYTGGEKSGMLVQDPSKGDHDVDTIFEQARRMGAVQGPFEPQPSSSSRSFTGTGRLLSGDTVPSAPQQPQNVVHTIYFWTNGFTVNDGPLRRFDDPENASFLESIRKSECPKELEPADRRTTVHVNLARREEKYPEPVRRLAPFQGVGRTIGSVSTDNSVSESAVAAPTSSTVPSPSAGLSVDASLPSTSIQLRLVDGTRMVARFNTHHTIGDIRAFIDASRPGAARNYQLQTVGFPPKQLTDDTKTIEEAGLANSVVIQKF